MSLSLIPSDVLRYKICPLLEEKVFLNFTLINKQTQRWGRDLCIWKEKFEKEIKNDGSFKLVGFDPKTVYSINKIPNVVNNYEKVSNVVQIITIAGAILYMLSNILANFESNKATSNHYCSDQSSLISVPCYVIYHSGKVAYIVVPLFVGISFKFDIKDRVIKVFSYFAHTSQVPDRTLPSYAVVLEKGMKLVSRTQIAFRRISNFFSGGN